MIVNKCHTCYKEIQSADELRGVKSHCPVCGDLFVVGDDRNLADEEIALASEPKRVTSPKAAAKPPATHPSPTAKERVADDRSSLPSGKVECPTCHELSPADAQQCPYCNDLIQRQGMPRKPKRKP